MPQYSCALGPDIELPFLWPRQGITHFCLISKDGAISDIEKISSYTTDSFEFEGLHQSVLLRMNPNVRIATQNQMPTLSRDVAGSYFEGIGADRFYEQVARVVQWQYITSICSVNRHPWPDSDSFALMIYAWMGKRYKLNNVEKSKATELVDFFIHKTNMEPVFNGDNPVIKRAIQWHHVATNVKIRKHYLKDAELRKKKKERDLNPGDIHKQIDLFS